VTLARENVGGSEQVVTSDGRLSYFFPGRVDVRYATTCGELDSARFFSFLTAGESRVLGQQEGQPLDPLGWQQCAHPPVRMVGEQPGIYAAFVVGAPPARTPTPTDCHISAAPGQLLDAVFGDGLTYSAAQALASRALAAGFDGARIERTNCSTFRVVVTGIPDDAKVQADFRAETARVGFQVSYAPALRYPEVAADIAAVPP